MTRSSLKDFISIILVAPYGITRRGKDGEKIWHLWEKKRPEHQQAELDLSLVLMFVQGLKQEGAHLLVMQRLSAIID